MTQYYHNIIGKTIALSVIGFIIFCFTVNENSGWFTLLIARILLGIIQTLVGIAVLGFAIWVVYAIITA